MDEWINEMWYLHRMEYYSALNSNGFWFMFKYGLTLTKRTNTLCSIYELSRIVNFIEAESRILVAGVGRGEGMGNYCLMGANFSL